MISDASISAALKFQDMASQVRSFLAAARIAAVGGLDWQEFGELMMALVRLTTTTLDSIATLSGPEKKELVLEAVATLFDQLADKCVPLVAWPLWLIARPAIRTLVLALAAGAVEQLLPLVRVTQS